MPAHDFNNPVVTQGRVDVLNSVIEGNKRALTQMLSEDAGDTNKPVNTIKFDNTNSNHVWKRWNGSSYDDLISSGNRVRFGSSALIGDWASSSTVASFSQVDQSSENYALNQASNGETRLNTGSGNIKFQSSDVEKIRMDASSFRCAVNKDLDLGIASRLWKRTYTEDLYFDGKLHFIPQNKNWTFFTYTTTTSLDPQAVNNATATQAQFNVAVGNAVNTIAKYLEEFELLTEV